MSCEYCETAVDVIAQESADGKMYAFIDKGRLCIQGYGRPPIPFVAGGHTVINYCPMCGSKIGDSDD